jgi:hypothetical protein
MTTVLPTKPGGAWATGIVVGLTTTGVFKGLEPGVKTCGGGVESLGELKIELMIAPIDSWGVSAGGFTTTGVSTDPILFVNGGKGTTGSGLFDGNTIFDILFSETAGRGGTRWLGVSLGTETGGIFVIWTSVTGVTGGIGVARPGGVTNTVVELVKPGAFVCGGPPGAVNELSKVVEIRSKQGSLGRIDGPPGRQFSTPGNCAL